MDFKDVFEYFLPLRVYEEGIFEAKLLLEREDISTAFFIGVIVQREEFVVEIFSQILLLLKNLSSYGLRPF